MSLYPFIAGFKQFQKQYFCDDRSLFRTLRKGQSPKTLVIACIDSRVDPALITGCNPGDLLVVRNVANLVPPYEPDAGYHGVSSALEFAVKHLEVEHIIVLGHSRCGGIGALMSGEAGESEFLGPWVDIARAAKEQAETDSDSTPEKRQCMCEQASILVSMNNLVTFPWIKERVEAKKLLIHGWYFDLASGELSSYLASTDSFEPLAPLCDVETATEQE